MLVENYKNKQSLKGRPMILEQKNYFGPDLGLLGIILGHNIFWGFSSTRC